MHHTRNLLIFFCALIPIWIVVGQDFTPSIFDREDGQIPLNPVTPAMIRGASSEILRLIRIVNPARFFPAVCRTPGY